MLNLHNAIVRTLRLRKEIVYINKEPRTMGVTRFSVENSKILSRKMKLNKAILIHRESNDDFLYTEWTGVSKDNQRVKFKWVFTGISAGYCGEGPRGLKSVLDNIGVPSSQDRIYNLKPGVYSLYGKNDQEYDHEKVTISDFNI